jgi:hypothetical protein
LTFLFSWELEAAEPIRPETKSVNIKLPNREWPIPNSLPSLVFTKNSNSRVHGFGKMILHSIKETLEHRAIRSSKVQVGLVLFFLEIHFQHICLIADQN